MRQRFRNQPDVPREIPVPTPRPAGESDDEAESEDSFSEINFEGLD